MAARLIWTIELIFKQRMEDQDCRINKHTEVYMTGSVGRHALLHTTAGSKQVSSTKISNSFPF